MWNNLKLSKKLGFSFGVLIAVTLLVSASVAYLLGQVRQAADWNEHTYKVLAQIDATVSGMVNQETGLRGYLVGGKETFLEPYHAGIRQTDKAIDEVQSLTSDNQAQQKRIADLRQLVSQWRTGHSEPVIKLMGQAGHEEEARGREASGAGKAGMDAIRAKAAEMSDIEAALLLTRSAYATSMSALANWSLVIGGCFSVFVSIFTAWIFGRTVTTPVTNITSVMDRIMRGDADASVDNTSRTDEIGDLSKTARAFGDAARKLREEAAASLDRDTVERERKEVEAAKAREYAEDMHAFAELGKGMRALAEGNLTFRIESEFTEKARALKADFNEAIAKLHDSMSVVAGNTATIRSSTAEISTASDDLSRRTEQQAAGLEQTAAALDQITATVRKTAEGANHANQVVGTAKEDAEHSGSVVRQAVEAMNSIEKSSGQIAQIITVIDEIAFQTNLLALNAGVEAARAGEAGRGFAVVASEVRALAQRSAEAAKEIKVLITASKEQVEEGVDLVAQTGTALTRIVGQVNEISSIVMDIAASAQEQSTGLEQVSTTFNQIDQATQKNAAMVEESTAATHALSQETEELARLIGRFNIGEGDTVVSMRTQGRPARSNEHSSTSAALRTQGRGGAARKPKIEAKPDSWNEF